MDDVPVPAGITHGAVAIVGMKLYMCGGYVLGICFVLLLFIGLISLLTMLLLFFVGAFHSDLLVVILDPTQQRASFTTMPLCLVVANSGKA
jgi:hypothetical protein